MWVRCKAGGERVVGAVVVQAACREGLGSRFGARARTLNICVMLVTLDVSKLSGWLNAFAPLNIHSMVVTRDVSKLSGWLNFHAVKNMPAMFVTPEVSQLGMSSSISCNPVKSQLMSVMPETSKSSMGPYVASASFGLEFHALSAVISSALVVKTPASGGDGDGGLGGGGLGEGGGGDGGDGGRLGEGHAAQDEELAEP